MGEIFSRSSEKVQWKLASPTDPNKLMSEEMAEAYQRCLRAADDACADASGRQRGRDGFPFCCECPPAMERYGFQFSCKFPPSEEGDVKGHRRLNPDAIAFQAVVVAAYHNLTGCEGQHGWIKHYNDADGVWHVHVGRFDGHTWKLKLALTPEHIRGRANAEAFDRWVGHQGAELIYAPVPEEKIDEAPRVRRTWGWRAPPPGGAATAASGSAAGPP